MAVSPPPAYQRLPGKKKGFIMGRRTLWRGRDHLLQIKARWGAEDYKRYYFNDIQAIITRKTAAGKIQNIVAGSLAGLFGIFSATSASGWFPLNTIIAVVMLLILLINIFKGPTCATHLLTAVQTEKLHSLNRLKSALAVMNQLKPIIERYQGRIHRDTLVQQSARLSDPKKKAPPTRLVQRLPKIRKHESGRVHLILFALLIFEGLIVATGFLLTHVGLTLLDTAVMLTMGICVVMALVKQQQSNLKHPLRMMTWAALGYVCFSFIHSYIISMGLAFKHPEIIQNQWEMIKLFSNTTPWDSPTMMAMNVIALSGAVAIGIGGLCLLKYPQQANPKSSDSSVTTVSVTAPKRIS